MTVHSGPIKIDSPIEYGKVYRDTITGFTGTCIGLTRWITGCDQIALQPKVTKDKDGKQNKDNAAWFDDGRLELVETQAKMPSSGHGPAGDPPADRVTS